VFRKILRTFYNQIPNNRSPPLSAYPYGICCFSCFNAQHLRVAQRIKKQSVDYYTSAKVDLIQSWRYKTLVVIMRR